jgi:hypothetical protein
MRLEGGLDFVGRRGLGLVFAPSRTKWSCNSFRLNVHTDVVLTVLANGCYRWLSQRLKGCTTMEPKQLYRKFVETGGTLTVRGDELLVSLDRRSHNPIVAHAALDRDPRPIPWLAGKRLHIDFK